MPFAWVLRNSVQLGPLRLGAGPRPRRRRMERIVVAPTLIPSLASSPEIRTHPQRGFSRAMRRISAVTSGSIGGRPGFFVLPYVHFFLTSSRCQRRSVLGLTRNELHRSRGSILATAASRARSGVVKSGRLL